MKRYMDMSYKHILFALLFCLFVASCKEHKEIPTVPPPVKVAIHEVNMTNNDKSREYSGIVSSSESTTVSFSVAGTITDLYFKEGQKVAKGQILGRVRSGEYENAYNIAKAELAEAQDGYNRLKKLHDANALPEIKWVEIQQKLSQAKNAAEMAERSLNDAVLRSPSNGTITKKFADVGQTVMPIEPIYEIVSVNNLTIDVSVSEREISGFNVGDKAKVDFPSVGLMDLEGVISRKAVVADPMTRTYTVEIDIPNPENKLLPGMIGTVIVQSSTDSNVLDEIVLPSNAVLLNEDSRVFVWVVEDSIANRRFITADELVSDGVVVKSGLEPGDKVIVAGMQKVGTGTKVVY